MSKQVLRGVLAVGLSLLLLTACGAGEDDAGAVAPPVEDDSGQDDTQDETGAEPASEEAPAPEEDPPAADQAVDPCALATDDEMAAVTGGTPQRRGPTEEFRGVTCQWEAGDALVSISVWQGAEFYDPEQQATFEYETLDIGDDAWREQQVVMFIKDETVVSIQVLGIPNQDDVVDIARRAESRL